MSSDDEHVSYLRDAVYMYRNAYEHVQVVGVYVSAVQHQGQVGLCKVIMMCDH